MKKILAIGMILALLLSACALAEDYSVGICQLVQHSALDAATQGFCDALTAKLGDSVKINEQNASGDSATCITIINGFISEDVDLIMANATPALQAAQAGTADIPILGTSVTDYATALDLELTDDRTGINVSGTSDLAPLDGQAEILHELFPDAKNVGLVYCSAEANSVYQIEIITKFLTEMGYSCTEFAFADSNDIASVVTNACAESDVIYIPTDNTASSCTETIRNIVEPEKVPVIAGEENLCRGCGLATLSISYYDLGFATGEMACEVLLNGADVSEMPIRFAPKFTKEFNPEMAEALGITIPDDYVAIG